MPKVKLNRPQIDEVKALILERQRAYKLTNTQMASYIGKSERTYQRMIQSGTNSWTVGDLFKLTRCIDIPKEMVVSRL